LNSIFAGGEFMGNKPLPDAIYCTVTLSSLPVPEMLIKATFETTYKNDYSFILVPTDNEGRTTLLKSQIISEASQQLRLAIMDYGPIEGCFSGIVGLRIMDEQDIRKALEAYDIFKSNFNFPADYQEALQKSIIKVQKINMEMLTIAARIVPDNIKRWIHMRHRYGSNYLKMRQSE
jgi:hypothetical protein